MKKVLLTGGAGFIGSVVAKELLVKGYEVICIDNFTDDLYDPVLKEGNVAELFQNESFSLHRVDVADLANLQKIFESEKPECIIHLAARANTRKAVADPYPYMDTNIVGTLNILEMAKSFGIKNTVIASSSSVYGNSTRTPFEENDTADRPLSPYGMSKRACELLAYTYHHNFNLNVTCLRYFNAYGENNRPDLVPYVWGRAILNDEEIVISGDGKRSRDYTYVGDIASGTIVAMEQPLGFEIINLGNSRPVSLNELLKVFELVVGKKVSVKSRPSIKSSVENTCANIDKAKNLLGWEPTTHIEDGIAKLVTWLKSRN
jgi:UDP-glucuronate 4-epimerase